MPKYPGNAALGFGVLNVPSPGFFSFAIMLERTVVVKASARPEVTARMICDSSLNCTCVAFGAHFSSSS